MKFEVNIVFEIALLLFTGVSANPIIPRQDTTTLQAGKPSKCSRSTSSQWLSICDTTIFWPTSTNYFYGPTKGAKASAVSCNAKWVQFSGRASGLESLGATSTSTIYSSYVTSTGACNTEVRGEDLQDTHTGPVTTLCDGITRALGPRESITDYWPGTGPCSSFLLTETTTTLVYRSPAATPACKLNTQDCIPIWSTYSKLSSAYYSSVTSEVPGDTKSPIRPESCPTTTRDYSDPNVCNNCHYLPDTATLFYWPVITTGETCLQSGTTLTATPTGEGPNTAIVDGKTFVSPSLYLSFTSIYAYSNQRAHSGGRCGSDHENVIVSIAPEAATSYRHHINAKYPTIGTAYPFNFAEYQPHQVGNYTMPLIPWEQYLGGSQCLSGGGGCSMVRDDYLPWFEMPDVMTQVDPLWTSCDRSWYIPPVSLVPLGGTRSLESRPTNKAEASRASATPAVPSSGLAAPTPKAT